MRECGKYKEGVLKIAATAAAKNTVKEKRNTLHRNLTSGDDVH